MGNYVFGFDTHRHAESAFTERVMMVEKAAEEGIKSQTALGFVVFFLVYSHSWSN